MAQLVRAPPTYSDHMTILGLMVEKGEALGSLFSTKVIFKLTPNSLP